MEVSFNELEARLKKAARGAGYPWGLAEEYAKSLTCLASSAFELDMRVVEFLKIDQSVNYLADLAYALDMRLPAPPSTQVGCDAFELIRQGFDGRLQQLGSGAKSTLTTRARVDEAVWLELEKLEYLTYAPDSEESRLKGAGAGVTDND